MQSTGHACVLDISLGEFEAHLYDEERAAATIKRYVHDAAHFLSFISERVTAKEDVQGDAIPEKAIAKNESTGRDCPAYTITKADTIAYKEYLLSHYSVRSVNTMLSSVSRYLDLCGASALKVRQVRVQNSHFQEQSRNLEIKDYHRLLRTARQKNASLAIGMEALAMTGARISELAFFTVSAVKSGRITIQNKGKRRVILIPGVLQRKLLIYAKARGIGKGCIFTTRGGKIKDRSNFWKEMKALAGPAGVLPDKVFPHNLRHLFARMYYRRTKDLPGLADVLGHSSLNVTRIYTAEPETAILTRMSQVIAAITLPE